MRITGTFKSPHTIFLQGMVSSFNKKITFPPHSHLGSYCCLTLILISNTLHKLRIQETHGRGKYYPFPFAQPSLFSAFSPLPPIPSSRLSRIPCYFVSPSQIPPPPQLYQSLLLCQGCLGPGYSALFAKQPYAVMSRRDYKISVRILCFWKKFIPHHHHLTFWIFLQTFEFPQICRKIIYRYMTQV